MTESSRDNRVYDRVDVRTVVTVVVTSPKPRSFKAWTDDLSPSGARILCEERITDTEVFLRVLLPGLKDQYFVAKPVRHEEVIQPVFRGRDRTLHSHGLVFTGICALQEIEALLGNGAPA